MASDFSLKELELIGVESCNAMVRDGIELLGRMDLKQAEEERNLLREK